MRLFFLISMTSFSLCATAFEITGIVTDPGGAAIAGADVWATQNRLPQTVQTDDQGRFHFKELDIGFIELVARKEGFAMGGINAQVVGDAEVAIKLGELDAVRLRIINERGEPVEGARITSLFVGAGSSGSARFDISVEDLATVGFRPYRSDAHGELTIDDVPKGGYVGFVLAHRDYAEHRIPYLSVGHRILTIPLYPGATLRGRVTDQKGEGIPHVRLSLFRVGAGGQREFAEPLTDQDGFYSAVVPPSDYYLAAYHPDYASPQPLSVVLPRHDQEYYCDLCLESACFVEGKIVNLEEKPMPGVRVAHVLSDRIHGETLSDNNGQFRLKINPGENAVRVIPPKGFVTEETADIRVVVADEPVVRLKKAVKVLPVPEISGVVIDPEGVPASGVLITSLSEDDLFWCLTDAQGAFAFYLAQAPPDGNVSFRAEHPLRFWRSDFSVDLRRVEPLRIALERFSPDVSANDPNDAGNRLELLVGKPAPEIECAEWYNSEQPVTLDALKGKVVVLTLWGGFDTRPVSRYWMDFTRILHSAYRDVQDVAFIGVHDSGIDAELVKRFVEEWQIDYPVGRDTDDFVTFDAYNTNVIPQTVLIDKAGVVRYYDVHGRLLELIKSLRREG